MREREREREEEGKMMAGSSSESEAGNGKWEWDGNASWCRVDHQGAVNSRLRRMISRAVKTTLQETKKWRDGLSQLRSRAERLETENEKQQTEQRKMWVSGASVVGEPGVSGSSDWKIQDWRSQFV